MFTDEGMGFMDAGMLSRMGDQAMDFAKRQTTKKEQPRSGGLFSQVKTSVPKFKAVDTMDDFDYVECMLRAQGSFARSMCKMKKQVQEQRQERNRRSESFTGGRGMPKPTSFEAEAKNIFNRIGSPSSSSGGMQDLIRKAAEKAKRQAAARRQAKPQPAKKAMPLPSFPSLPSISPLTPPKVLAKQVKPKLEQEKRVLKREQAKQAVIKKEAAKAEAEAKSELQSLSFNANSLYKKVALPTTTNVEKLAASTRLKQNAAEQKVQNKKLQTASAVKEIAQKNEAAIVIQKDEVENKLAEVDQVLQVTQAEPEPVEIRQITEVGDQVDLEPAADSKMPLILGGVAVVGIVGFLVYRQMKK